MKAAVIFTGTGPILVLTTYDSFTSQEFADKLRSKGIKKYIVSEISLDLCRQVYGRNFDIIMQDVKQDDDLRVLDYNGHSVFHAFKFKDMGAPQFVEETEDKNT